MGFIATDGGQGGIRFEEVARHRSEGDFVHFTTKRGEDFKVTAGAWQRAFARELVGVVPAQPGTFQLEWAEQDDEGNMGWDQMPVIAWGIGLDGFAVSIGGDGIDEFNRAVLHPSGQVTKGTMGSWPSFTTYEEACQQHDYLRN